MTKDEIWTKLHIGLIEVASAFDYDDWLGFMNKYDVETTMEGNGKYKAQTLLEYLSEDDLVQLLIIGEDDDVDYDSISYKEVGLNIDGSDHVELWDSEEFLGYIKVWIDSGKIEAGIAEKESTYLCVNHEMMYLDNLTKLNECD